MSQRPSPEALKQRAREYAETLAALNKRFPVLPGTTAPPPALPPNLKG